eukprot:383192-Amphidinium_carterae.1
MMKDHAWGTRKTTRASIASNKHKQLLTGRNYTTKMTKTCMCMAFIFLVPSLLGNGGGDRGVYTYSLFELMANLKEECTW